MLCVVLKNKGVKMSKTEITRVLFLHVRKTAGTSARVALKNIFELENECPLRSQLELNGKVRAQFQTAYFEKFDFIAGHFHRVAPIAGPEFKTVIFLRDPVARVISAYNHVKNDTMDPLHRFGFNKPLLECLDMPELCEEFQNAQTRYLVGNSGYEYSDLNDDERLHIAVEYLKEVDFIGLTELFDLSLALFARSVGTNPLKHTPKLNQEITASGPKRMDLIDLHFDILKRNRLDSVVLEKARAEFSSRAMKLITG